MGDDLFHIIQEAQIVLRSKGTFYQKKVFRRGDRIYAQMGSGFIRIGAGDATSNPSVSWESLDLPKGVIMGRDKGNNPTIILMAVQKEVA